MGAVFWPGPSAIGCTRKRSPWGVNPGAGKIQHPPGPNLSPCPMACCLRADFDSPSPTRLFFAGFPGPGPMGGFSGGGEKPSSPYGKSPPGHGRARVGVFSLKCFRASLREAGKGIISMWESAHSMGKLISRAWACVVCGHVGYGVIYPNSPPRLLRPFVCAAAFRCQAGRAKGGESLSSWATVLSPVPDPCLHGLVSIRLW